MLQLTVDFKALASHSCLNPIILFFYHAWIQGGYFVRASQSHAHSTLREILVWMWHASIQNVKKYSLFERIRGPAFGFVWLRPGETELSNKNKSQINYGPEQGARQFVHTLYVLQTPLCLQCFDSAVSSGGMIWIQDSKLSCLTLTRTISLLV